MDTQKAAAFEVPNFKLAKVGKDRERKRGGGFLGARSASSAFSGAAGGAGAGASGILGTGMSLAKLLTVLMLAGGTGVCAWKAGHAPAVNTAGLARPAAPKLFDDKYKSVPVYSDAANVVKTDNAMPNSLGYVSGSSDGLTPEQRARKEAEEKAASEADAKKKADEDAAKAAAAPAPAAPAATAASGAAPQPNLGGSRFGSLNSGLGGGGGKGASLSGGSGLSGGIGGNFAPMKSLTARAPNGAMSGFAAPGRPGMTAASHPTASKSNAKGFAHQQLDNTFAASRAASGASRAESAAAGAGAPFDNNSTKGTIITGAGDTTGSAAASPSAGNSANSPSSGGGGGGGGDQPACGQGEAPDINGNCYQIAGPATSDATPDISGMVKLAMGLMIAIAAINIIALIWSNSMWFKALAGVLVGVMCAMAAVVTTLGLMIMGKGEFLVGGILTVVGGFLTVQAAMALTGMNAIAGSGAGTPMTLANTAAPNLVADAAGALSATAASSMH